MSMLPNYQLRLKRAIKNCEDKQENLEIGQETCANSYMQADSYEDSDAGSYAGPHWSHIVLCLALVG